MRKRIRILVLSLIVAAVIVPLGFALSLESKSAAVSASSSRVEPVSQLVYSHAPIVATTTTAVVTSLPAVPEGAKLFAIGTVLFALAAAMRRSGSKDA
jgi:hypothetical protein